jgi:hypothetical protein
VVVVVVAESGGGAGDHDRVRSALKRTEQRRAASRSGRGRGTKHASRIRGPSTQITITCTAGSRINDSLSAPRLVQNASRRGILQYFSSRLERSDATPRCRVSFALETLLPATMRFGSCRTRRSKRTVTSSRAFNKPKNAAGGPAPVGISATNTCEFLRYFACDSGQRVGVCPTLPFDGDPGAQEGSG